ncbi:lecithin retinol acyltransferase family protein [Succinimonas sp.]|uniref:lecithin retinol acyltransferase family protein n=1 Tax=Succinimonas sp. TaxID=1936151 RepID=UPI003865388F
MEDGKDKAPGKGNSNDTAKNLLKAAGVFTLLFAAQFPVRAAINTIKGNYIDAKVATPALGSVLYRDLGAGFMEHSGIYVGGGENCIAELQNDNGESIIKLVTPEVFTSVGVGATSTIYVSCKGDTPVGDPEVARRALSMAGQDLGKYDLLMNNCHMFVYGCLKAAEAGEEFDPDKMHRITKDHWARMEMSLANLKHEAEKNLKACDWRVWDWQNNPGIARDAVPGITG